MPKGGLILLTVDWGKGGGGLKSDIKHFLSFVGKSQFEKRFIKKQSWRKKGIIRSNDYKH